VKEGYKPLTIHISHEVSAIGALATVAGNWVLGGFIGVGVDLATGAMYDLSPGPVHVALEKNMTTPVVDVTMYSAPRRSAHSAPVTELSGGYRSIPTCGRTAYPSLCLQIRPSYSD
jgi:hypothetical protein